MTVAQRRIAKVLLFAACLTPFVLLVLAATQLWGSLGPNPPEYILNTCGKTALNILLISLAVSPLRRLTKWNFLIAFRRMLGLFSFFYLLLHFTSYLLLDLGLAWDTLWNDIVERPYITVGMAALVLMIPLAITSTHGMQRRLKRKWLVLHRAVYVIAVLGVVHYFWQTKLDVMTEPVIYSIILAVLLGERVYRRFERQRRTRAAIVVGS
jgi:sulfoxide reductase heme-binding subunit YedZ